MIRRTLAEVMTRDTEPHQIPETLYGNLIDAVRKNLILAPMSMKIGAGSIKGSSIDIVTEDRDSSAVHSIGEGQEVPIDLGETSTFNLKPTKFGLRPVVTKEMQEDGQWDMITWNMNLAGYKMADKLDTLLFTELDTGAALTTDDNGASRTANTTSGAFNFANLTATMKMLEEDGYKCTDMICHPAVVEDIRNIAEFVHADKSGTTNPSQGLIGRIFGMDVHMSRNATSNYAYIIDRRHALIYAEKRPVTIERYNDVTRDLSGVVVTARWDARYLRPDAMAYIDTS